MTDDGVNESNEDSYQCDITESYFRTEDNRLIKVYGLYLYNRDSKLAVLRNESSRVDDISEDREKVIKLKRLIDEEKLYPIHLKEVVEDYLS